MTESTKNTRTVANQSHQESILHLVHREVVDVPRTAVHQLPGRWSPRSDGVVGLIIEASRDDAVALNGEFIDGSVAITLGDTINVGENITAYTTPHDHGEGAWINVFDYSNTELADRFHGIDEYPFDEDWVVEARYVPNDSGHAESSFNRFRDGEKVFTLPTPGAFHTTIAGREYSLEVVPYAGEHYLFFKDATTGNESHPVGRGLVLFAEDLSTIDSLDFNDSKLSPCALNHLLSCPLPPEGNTIAVPVRAGQRTAVFADA